MAARIEVQVGKIRGPWLDVVVERVHKYYIMGIIAAHLRPCLRVTPHTAKPEVLPGVWKLTPYAKEATSGVKLVGIQAELFPKNLQSVDGTIRRWRLKLVVNKSGVGFFEVESVAIVRDGYIATTEELVEFLNEEPVLIATLFISGVVRESSDMNLVFPLPLVSEA